MSQVILYYTFLYPFIISPLQKLFHFQEAKLKDVLTRLLSIHVFLWLKACSSNTRNVKHVRDLSQISRGVTAPTDLQLQEESVMRQRVSGRKFFIFVTDYFFNKSLDTGV